MTIPTNDTYISRKKRLFPWFICGLAALFYCYEYFLRITPSVMTHELMSQFQINATQLGNLAAFYYYAYDPMQLPVGMMMDRFGPRRLLTLACIICALGTFLFTMHVLSIAQFGRFMVGFGSAFAFVGVLKLATIWLPPERFGMVAGMLTAMGMLGAMGGDIALASLVQAIGWSTTVAITSILGLILAVIMWLVIRDHSHRSRRVEKQAALSAKELFAGAFNILRNPQIWLNGFVACCLFLPLTALAELWGISYAQEAYNLTKVDAATAISMLFLGFAIGGTTIGWISDRIRRRCLPLIIGGIISALLSAVLFYVRGLPTPLVFILLLLIGVFASAQVLCFAVASEISQRRLAGTAIAVTNLFTMLGGVVFQPLIGKLLDTHWDGKIINGVHYYSVQDYNFALAVVPIGLTLGALAACLLTETRASYKHALDNEDMLHFHHEHEAVNLTNNSHLVSENPK